ncbi:MAG: GldG family protein [Ruminococcus sp.]|nr:GldG family protein [Ruminococcus sp.]MCD7801127.1 GldG family protein [Ruminococcus sp.]
MNKDNKDLHENSVKETPENIENTKDVSTENSTNEVNDDMTNKHKKNKKPKKEKKDKPKKEKKKFNTKKLKYGTLATVFTLIIVAIVVAVNLIVQDVTERFDLTMDLTDNDIYTISQDTIDYLVSIEDEIEITVLADESAFENNAIYFKQASEVIKKYALYSDKISVSFVDMNKNPSVVTRFNEVYKGDLTEGDIVVFREALSEDDSDRIKVLSLSSLFTTSTDSYGNTTVSQSNAEQELTSAVMYVTDANPKKAVLVSTDMPTSVYASAQSLLNMLSSNGYDLEEVDLLTDDLDIESTDLLLILSPLNDFSTPVIDKISDYLYNDGNLGKNVLYMANYDQNTTSNIDEFLEEWGLAIGDSYIAETNTSASQNVSVYGLGYTIRSSIGVIANDDYADLVSDTTLPIAVPLPRPIEILWETNGDRETSVIMTTSNTSALIPRDATDDFDISTAVTGLQNVMAMGSKYVFNEDNEKITSNVMVMGSAFMTDIYITSDTSYNNGEFILNAINKMTGKSSGITIVPKSLSISTISIDDTQILAIRTVVMFVIPLVIVAIGVVVYIRRRNK